ncbi:MAG: YidC/Oxa1 family membrane protein insertase [Candidatus Saccharimonadales bacterium]
MNFFDLILVQPIFNVLVVIYGLIPGNDFGVALILFTILIRLAMWPLVKKQLRQTKVMRELQPELARIKKKGKGNKQLEAQMMMELYRERGVNPFGSIGLLLVQLPIFIALFAVVNLITQNGETIAKYTYDFLEQIPAINAAIGGQFNESLLGLIDLTAHATQPGAGIYWPLMILAVVAAVLQFIQSKQLLPQPKEKKRLRDMLKEQAKGKQVDQAEMSALMTNKMVWLFPILTFLVSIYLAGALVLYLVTTSAVAVIQQAIVLKKDEEELGKLSEKTKARAQRAKPAEVVGKKKRAKKTRRK